MSKKMYHTKACPAHIETPRRPDDRQNAYFRLTSHQNVLKYILDTEIGVIQPATRLRSGLESSGGWEKKLTGGKASDLLRSVHDTIA